jgi:hypothetical protein
MKSMSIGWPLAHENARPQTRNFSNGRMAPARDRKNACRSAPAFASATFRPRRGWRCQPIGKDEASATRGVWGYCGPNLCSVIIGQGEKKGQISHLRGHTQHPQIVGLLVITTDRPSGTNAQAFLTPRYPRAGLTTKRVHRWTICSLRDGLMYRITPCGRWRTVFRRT